MLARPARPEDASAMASIYNEGIVGRTATFETEPREAADVLRWLDGVHPVVVVEDGGEVLGFAATFEYRARPCYDGVAEFSVYVAAGARRRGVGRAAMEALAVDAEQAGFWKLVSRVFPENTPSLALLRSCGFREVGLYERHGKLDGEWRDTVIVERLIGAGSEYDR